MGCREERRVERGTVSVKAGGTERVRWAGGAAHAARDVEAPSNLFAKSSLASTE